MAPFIYFFFQTLKAHGAIYFPRVLWMLSTSQVIQNTSGTDGLETLSVTLVSSLAYFSLASAFSSHLSEMWNVTFGKGFVFVSYFWLRGHQALENEGKAGDKQLCCKTGKNIMLLVVLLTVQHPWGVLLVTRGLPEPLGRERPDREQQGDDVTLKPTAQNILHALSHRWGWGPWWFGCYYYQRNTLTKCRHIPSSCSSYRGPSCSAQEASWTDNLLIHS